MRIFYQYCRRCSFWLDLRIRYARYNIYFQHAFHRHRTFKGTGELTLHLHVTKRTHKMTTLFDLLECRQGI